jgi:zona occludens toxin (predicted ATPase)
MAAAQYDFEIEQGATLLKPIVWKDSTGAAVNLTGYTAKMQVRQSTSSDEVLLELSNTNGKLTITPLTGTVTMVFSAATTADIDWKRGKYDLELTAADGTVTRLIEGEITVSREITR